MPTQNCVKEEENSLAMDRAMTVCSFISLAVATCSLLYHAFSPTRRKWPKRTVTLLSGSVWLLEATYSIGAFVGYKQLKQHYDGSTWQHVCLVQGALFNWSAICMVSLLFWFHYTQFNMLCAQIPSATIQRKEKIVLTSIVIFATVFTLVPILTHHVNARPNFYGCWIDDGVIYWTFYVVLLMVLATANYWCYQSVQWLSKVAESLVGEDRPEALQSLKKYKSANMAIVAGTVYIVSTLLLDLLKELLHFSLGSSFCFLISFDVLLFPLIFVAFSHGVITGFSCWDSVCCCCLPHRRSDSGRNRAGSGRDSPLSSNQGRGGQKMSNPNDAQQRQLSHSRDGTDSIFEPFLESSFSSKWSDDEDKSQPHGQGNTDGYHSTSAGGGGGSTIGGGDGGGDYHQFEEEGYHPRHHDGSLSSHIIPPAFDD